eukprot:4537241-Amphidinium_carterae.1
MSPEPITEVPQEETTCDASRGRHCGCVPAQDTISAKITNRCIQMARHYVLRGGVKTTTLLGSCL